ncbi:uncharacterized protein LOC108456048 [Gossypium arboreum]|nr:uncharacterized protein LOC108456048 [Gossypium arboreum]
MAITLFFIYRSYGSLVFISCSLFFFFLLLSFTKSSSSSLYSLSFFFSPSTMVDLQTVCCMCGDVGFPDKLFRCNKCRHRFQHSYCSNYYSEFAEPIELCDWCQSEAKNSRQGRSSKKPTTGNESGIINRSEYSGDKIKLQDRDESGDHQKGKSSGTPSPRPTTRRYKLLKDVMC